MTDTDRSHRTDLLFACWPLLAVVLIALVPLGWVLALGLLVFASWRVLTHERLSAAAKAVTVTGWLAAVAALGYCLVAFNAQVEASDLSRPAPAWAGAVPIALLAAVALLLIAGATLLRTGGRTPAIA